MRRLLDIGFFLVIALACAGLDFYLLKRDRGDGFGVAQYVALRQADVNDILHPPSLAAALPSEIEGWDVSTAGADQIIPGSDQSRADQVNEIALVKAIAALEKAKSPEGEMVGMTLTKDDTRLRVMAVLVKQEPKVDGIDRPKPNIAPADTALAAILQDHPYGPSNPAYSVVDGVAFVEMPAAAVTGDPQLRMMRAHLGNALSVTVVTKSTDNDAIRAAMQGIDFVMLNKLLHVPVPGVEQGRNSDLRQDPANLSAEPVPVATLDSNSTPAANLSSPAPNSAAPSQAAPAKAKAALAETAVFVAPPSETVGQGGQPCVRRAGVLVCPDG